MEQNPVRNDARKARRRRKLGPTAPCVFCGRETPEPFRKVGRSVVEEHHVMGVANDTALTVPACRGCHDAQTELQRVYGIDLRHHTNRPWPETLVDILKAIGLLLKSLGGKLMDYAERLRAFLDALDRHWPQWRLLPEAQR